MPADQLTAESQSFATFGALLRYLRRRARLTQRDLGIAVGYSEGHINRFEKNKHLPDPSAVAALFVPALDLGDEPTLATRLINLASISLTPPLGRLSEETAHPELLLEPLPAAAPHEITRARTFARVRDRLAKEHRLVLCGLPGIGKTTLASAIARDYAKTMPVFWLTLTEGVTVSAELWVRRLAAFLMVNGQNQVKSLVAADLGVGTKLSFDQQMALLASVFVKQPALLCFDNAELIRQEETCLQLLRHLSATTPTFLLLTTRESLPLERVSEMTIEGLENEEGLAFISSSGYTFDKQQIGRLLEKTGGNPMLLHLAFGRLRDHPTEADSFIAHLETQPQVAAYLLQTLQGQMSPQAWRLLLLVAIFQQPLNLYDPYLVELISSLGGIDHIGNAITELQWRYLIGDAAAAQLHPFIREYVYCALSAQMTLRQRLHRLAADWLKDANQDVVAAARHYNYAGLPDQALDLIEEHRDAIIARGQRLTAVAVLDELHTPIKRQRASQSDLRRRLLTARDILLAGTLRILEGENNLREAVTLANNPAVRANIVCHLAELALQRSDAQETLRLVQTARAELAPNDLLLRARLVSIETAARETLGNFEETIRTANEALALTDQMAGMPLSMIGEIQVRASSSLANEARVRRDLTTAMSHAQSALASARAAHLPRQAALALQFVGGLFYDQGDLDAAFRYRNEGLEELLAIGDLHSAAYAQTTLADIHHLRLEVDQALLKLEQASETLRIVNDMRGLAAAESLRTSCLLWCGQISQAREVIERLLKEAEGKGTERQWCYRLMKRAMVQLVQGETDPAITTLRQAHDLPPVRTHSMMHFDLHSTLALALAVAGDAQSALRELAHAPRLEGLSRWSELERDLTEGYIALASGDAASARRLAAKVSQRGGECQLYRERANQLKAAIRQSAPVSAFPRLIWVRSKSL